MIDAPDPPPHVCLPHEIVPGALRNELRWDERHDAMARLVMKEYSLVLPQHRELIRQLSFVRVQQGAAHFMPIGKHKGRLLEEILHDDPGYAEWLTEQAWFREKFPDLHKIIVELAAEQDEDEDDD